MHLKKIKNKFSFKRGANRKNRKIIIMAILFIILLSLVYFLKVARHFPKKINLNHKADFFGVTFSTKYSKEIGLDWKEVFLATVDDLKVRQIRLPIYWDEVESVEGVYDFSKYDYIILEGEKRGVNFIVNVGLRLPRWPECHSPKWADDKSIEYKQAKVIEMITTTVDRYKDRSSIVVWQLENEPFFNQFGVCPPADEEFFNEELATLRSLDDRPVLITATGELSFWKKKLS